MMFSTCVELWSPRTAGAARTCPWGGGHCHQEWCIEPQIIGGIFYQWPLQGGVFKAILRGWMLAFLGPIFKEFQFEKLFGCDFEKKAEKSVVLSGFLPLGNFSQFRRLPSKVARFVFSPHHHCLNRTKKCCIQWLFSFQNSNWCLYSSCY